MLKIKCVEYRYRAAMDAKRRGLFWEWHRGYIIVEAARFTPRQFQPLPLAA